MYAPLIWKGEVLGVVLVDNSETKYAFNEDDLRLLLAMASQAAMFVKNHTLQQELRRQEVVRSNLLRQFSPQVAERLERMLKETDQWQLGGKRAEPVTILVSDVRGFSAMSANMEPGEVVEMLNELFGVCIPLIFKYNGTVDKFVGDSILAVFGSPEPDEQQWANAVRAALEIQQAIRAQGSNRQSRHLPACQVGIGIHTGAVLHGFIGVTERMEYTVIGDTVNRAARYCDGAGRGEVIISPEVYTYVANLVEVAPKTIRTKHPESEPDMEAYLVKAWKAKETDHLPAAPV
jgi:adenylate cyclase